MISSGTCRRNAIRLLHLPRRNPEPQLPPGCRQSHLSPTLPPPPKIPTASNPLSENPTALQHHLHRKKKPTRPNFLSASSYPIATTHPPAPNGPPPASTAAAAIPFLFHSRSRRHVCRPVSFASTSAACQDITMEKIQIGIRWFSTTDVSSYDVLEMPALSPTMNQGNIAKWRKKEGDKINTGDVICEIETDKAVLEFESIEEGFLAKILAPGGSKDVPVGQPIAITVEDLDEVKNIPTALSGNLEKNKSSDKDVAEKSSEKDVEHKGGSPKANFSRVGPAAKLLISEFGLDISSLKASGPRGTLLKSDILEVIKSGGIPSKSSGLAKDKPTASGQHSTPSSPPPPSFSSNIAGALLYEDIPHTQIRKVIARRLVESKQNTPHFYSSADVILDPLLAFRNVLKEQHNVKVSINDIIIKAVAVSLQSVPEANAIWNDKEGKASLCDTIDISIAVATEKGLMTPIVRNANRKSLSAISLEVKELAEKARVGKLTPDQFQGGTFSISNLGMFPVDRFCAIINPPQACILAVGRGNKVVEPVIGNDGVERPTVLTKMCLNLSADHRVYDSEIGGKLLSTISANLNNVQRLLL